MDAQKITVRYTDTGHYIARCNHQTGVIELSKREFGRLSPMSRDYAWCHEYVHLLCDIHDEAECNAITDAVFVSRAKNDIERRARMRYVEAGHDDSMSKLDVFSAVFEFATKIAEDVITDSLKNKAFWNNYENGGFNSIDEASQKTIVDTYMKLAFKKSRRVSDRSAKDIFWGYMETIVAGTKDSTYSQFISNHKWMTEYAEKYEKEYGFAFDAVLPIDNTDIYLWIVVGALAIIATVLLIKKFKK